MKTLLIELAIACILELINNAQVSCDPFIFSTRFACLQITLSQSGIDLAIVQEQFNQ